ncbi:unnamed protein product [Colletotrichum noveboracense]|uniref:Enoyl reductase (ER) domain-containing protein n=1 Tax=Colletotrichum noveboracense TaxID=2664923 RepID=A0A9W4RNR3_9PEZI|nr:hypothetical protein K456DRAFT_1749413 [Colletotrichum gloeosporioides 23]CAI0644556.1 unnamed protein product [Colletotrichum noveboracense]
MKEALIDNALRVKIHDVPIPTPSPGQLLIRTIVPQASPSNYGDDIAGYVEAVGEGVLGFSKGDRVAAFHEMGAPHGSYAEYSIAWADSAFHIPAHITFEEAATIPLTAMMAALGLYQRLGLPLPWSAITEPLPLIIYGGATAVGSYAIKLAALSNIHPIIAVAGNGTSYVNTLLDKSKGDTAIDYRQREAHTLEKIKEAAGENPIIYALDTVSESNTLRMIDRALAPGKGKIANLLPSSPKNELSSELTFTMVGTIHASKSTNSWPALGDREFGTLFCSFFGRGLQEGWFHGHPYEVRTGGLDALGQVLRDLEAGKNSAKKYLVKIAETKGVM